MCNCCWCGERICSTYCERVFLALSNQHTTHMRCIILSCIPCLILAYFSTLFHERFFFRRDVLNKKYTFWIRLQICSVKFLILRRIQTDIVLKVHFSLCNHCKCLVKLELLNSLSSGSQQTATTNLVVTFLKFVKASNIRVFLFVTHLKYPKTHTYPHLN